MMNWLINNLGTIVVVLALAAIVSCILIKMIRDRKNGKSSCGCNCAHCAMAGKCHSKQ